MFQTRFLDKTETQILWSAPFNRKSYLLCDNVKTIW